MNSGGRGWYIWSWKNTLNRIKVKLHIGHLNEMSNSTCVPLGLKWGGSGPVVARMHLISGCGLTIILSGWLGSRACLACLCGFFICHWKASL